MAGGPRIQTVGRSAYRSQDGKTWVLDGADAATAHGLAHTWRIKVNKANQQTFFVNQADPTRKVWELPEVDADELGSVGADSGVFMATVGSGGAVGDLQASVGCVPTPLSALSRPPREATPPRAPGLSRFASAPPSFLDVTCPSKPAAEGRYQLVDAGDARTPHPHPHRDATLPQWAQVAPAAGGVLYGSTSGEWVVSPPPGAGNAPPPPVWIKSTAPHLAMHYPHQLPGRWGHLFRGAVLPDPAIRVVVASDARTPTPATPPPPAARPGSLDHLLGGAAPEGAAPDSPQQTLVSGRSMYYLENDYWVLQGRTLEDKLHTWKMKHERDGTRVFINPWTRTKLLALPDYVSEQGGGDDPAAVAPPPAPEAPAPAAMPDALSPEAYDQLDGLEAKLVHERAVLAAQAHDVSRQAARSAVPPGQDLSIAAHAAQQASRASSGRNLPLAVYAAQQQARSAAPSQDMPLTAHAAQHGRPPPPGAPLPISPPPPPVAAGDCATTIDSIPPTTTASVPPSSTAVTLTGPGPYSSVLAAFERELTDRKNALEREAATALESHQRYLRDRAHALEHEHEVETRRLQDAARHLEALTKSRLAENSNKAAEADVLAEQRRLQEDVDDFYKKTSEAVDQAKRSAEEHKADESPQRGDDETMAGGSSCGPSSIQEILEALQQGRVQLQSGHDRHEATQERKLAEMQAALQQSMADQMQDLREEFARLLTQRAAEPAPAPPPPAAEAPRDDEGEVARLEKLVANLRVEHEAEKAALLRAAADEAEKEKEKAALVNKRLAEALAENEHTRQKEADAGGGRQRVDELRKEVVRLKTEKADEQDRFVKQLKDAADALEQTRREKALVEDDLRNVKDLMRHEQRSTLDAIVRDAEGERANLVAAHRREVEASAQLLREAHDLNGQLQQQAEAARAAPVPNDVLREVEELKAELRVIKKENQSLREAFDEAQARADAAPEPQPQPQPQPQPPSAPTSDAGAGARDAPKGDDATVDVSIVSGGGASGAGSARNQLKTFLEGEMGKLQSEYLDPPVSVQHRLRRFRERSASRSHSAEAPPAPPSYQRGGYQARGASHVSSMRSVSPQVAYPGYPSPSPSPHQPPPVGRDDMRRLRHLKEQIKHRLSVEQASTY
eukprot:TRINITY_DN1109_c0_g4_i1.p1 TRINITY_DN1109_c0_g4~~TRINITY_DN1109_c0_g4_i1.p1  ORF type:complete len:1132 (+),score=456.86 TRINITY_DN1109_c0_g4_i1:62-3457(+)